MQCHASANIFADTTTIADMTVAAAFDVIAAVIAATVASHSTRVLAIACRSTPRQLLDCMKAQCHLSLTIIQATMSGVVELRKQKLLAAAATVAAVAASVAVLHLS